MIYDFCVIGGGIVGVATARALLLRHRGASLVLLEKEDRLGAHQTGRNSGVIHSGVYYEPGSLKARLCARGTRETKEYCREKGIPYEDRGKLIVATSDMEVARLERLTLRAEENGIAATALRPEEIREREPEVRGLSALHIPATAIVNYREILKRLAADVGELGGEVLVNRAASGISEEPGRVRIACEGGDGFEARFLVACAGLQSDRLARLSGLRTTHQIVPFRGEFYRLAPGLNRIVHAMIYPVPDPALPFLGIHVTPTIDGRVMLGPNAVLALAREGYRKTEVSLSDMAEYLAFRGFWRTVGRNLRAGTDEMLNSLIRRRYLEMCRRYVPGLSLADLEPAPSGIRAQAVLADGTLVHDFMFERTARMLHVLNAPSPAATSALPIAEMIVDRVVAAAAA